MIRILCMLLIVLSPMAFAQTEEAPRAVKVDEFETATNGYVKMIMDYFYVELNNNPASQGVIINYGTEREIIIREKQIRVSIRWRKYDASRITLVNGGFSGVVKSEFWLVPPGAENPQPILTAEKIDEFRKVPDGDLKARLDGFYSALMEKTGAKGYILNFGPAPAIASEEARVKRYFALRKYDLSKIVFKNAGLNKVSRTEFWIVPADGKKLKTEFWIVPPGAKPPTR